MLAPDRLNALVFGGFAAVALMIAVVGVAGVLAFSVSARTREFGIRLAIGSEPRHLLTRVLGEGAVIAVAGIVAGAIGGVLLARLAGSFIQDVRIPGALPVIGAAAILVAAAILASLMPAARASRVDVISALRGDDSNPLLGWGRQLGVSLIHDHFFSHLCCAQPAVKRARPNCGSGSDWPSTSSVSISPTAGPIL